MPNHRTSPAALTASRLRELLHYDPETGVFTWRVRWGSACPGDIAARIHIPGDRKRGYGYIAVDGVRYSANRLAWLYMTGKWPSMMVDHADGDPGNDRFTNLREATATQNLMNMRIRRDNTSGFKGVNFHGEKGRWRAYIQHAGRRQHLGYFDTAQEAHKAYCAAAMKIDPVFARFA